MASREDEVDRWGLESKFEKIHRFSVRKPSGRERERRKSVGRTETPD
jgi:hypothetical protein